MHPFRNYSITLHQLGYPGKITILLIVIMHKTKRSNQAEGKSSYLANQMPAC